MTNVNDIDETNWDQHIVICLRDRSLYHPATYVQVTRRRFKKEDAEVYIRTVSKERKPVIVPVPNVMVNQMGYPIFDKFDLTLLED